jgi:hypothetical protein
LIPQQELREGILEIFVEAARLGRALLPKKRVVLWNKTYFEQALRKDAERRAEAARRSNERLKERLIYNGRPAVEVDVCPNCGARIELREGIARWQHVGREGLACRNSRAVTSYRGLRVL